MAKIKALPKEVYEKIKAGEVVEDPASVIRELLDNALDSGATRIEIEIQEGGLALIQVKDNGSGMDEEDLRVCFLPHTTSKISRFEDIFSLFTRGFRGEALSSIARVSQLKILSCPDDSGRGMALTLEGGQIIRQNAEKREQGTTVSVSGLFYNVPVRRNFAGSPVKETRKIKEEVLTRALAHPELELILTSGKNTLLHFLPSPFEERIRQGFQDRFGTLIPFHYQAGSLSIKGAVSDLNHTAGSSADLYFFINNRFVKPRFLYAAVNTVFANLIPRGRYPAGVFYLYVEPGQIDPNIHPSKKEIRVLNENQVFFHLGQALKQVFMPGDSKPAEKPLASTEKFFTPPEFKPAPEIRQTEKPEPGLFAAPTLEEALPAFRYLGTVFKTYLLAEKNDELWIIDFHAAHERKRYEELKARFENSDKETLLSPRIFNLSPKEVTLLSEKRDFLNRLGFDFYLFGEDAAVITGVPGFYQGKNWEEDFKEILTRTHADENPLALKDKMLKSAACRGSYMGGDTLHPSEAEEILRMVFESEIPLTCPHGRPLAHRIAKKHMASFFLRTASE